MSRNRIYHGYLYSLEVLVAISIILVAMVFIFRDAPQKPEMELDLIKIQGFQLLEYLDNSNELRNIVVNGNEADIESRLVLLPKSIGSEAEICREYCNQTNVPGNGSVVSVDYYVSGYKDRYVGKKVKVWLWRKS